MTINNELLPKINHSIANNERILFDRQREQTPIAVNY